ncbi:triose-phosphate isomerase family protein [Mycobacterium sp. LTG2003]
MPDLLVGVSLKMYFGRERTTQWCRAVAEIADSHPAVTSGSVKIVVLPSYPYLTETLATFAHTSVAVGAQDLCSVDEGAFTGEVSGRQLAELGCRYVEVGHAERRRLFGEDDTVVAAKTAAAFRNHLTPILCIGELHHGTTAAAVEECQAQLHSALATSADDSTTGPLVVAYEPQWAIGAAEPASPEYITAVCTALGDHVESMPQFAGSHVIYGGSAGPGLFTQIQAGVDGLFLGRFAHDPAALGLILDETLEGAPL